MKTEKTKQLERLLEKHFDTRKDFFVFECTIGWYGHEIVDCIKYTTDREICCYEIKQSKSDFRSKNALTFIGNKNYFVMPYSLYGQVKDEIPPDIGVYVAIDHWETETIDGWQQAKYIDGLSYLHCIKSARRKDLKADKEVILSSMLRSMQRDRRQAVPQSGVVSYQAMIDAQAANRITQLEQELAIAQGTKSRLTIFDRIELHDKVAKSTAKDILSELSNFIGSRQKFCIVDEQRKELIEVGELFGLIGKLTKKYMSEAAE